MCSTAWVTNTVPSPAMQQVARADGSALRGAMQRLAPTLHAGRWLDRRNPYRTNAAASIRNHVKQGRLIRPKVLEYLAVSTILHCFDGWSYLGRALQAEMSCDPDASRHLGYYAELRAAMAVLASEGIGVFDRHHVVVDAGGSCHGIANGGTTHAFTWDALETWADTKAGDVLLRVINVYGIALAEWLDQFRSTGVHAIASDWLRSWGLDLCRMTQDRDARNTASYRPTALESSGPRSIVDVMQSVTEMWRLFEPSGTAPFRDLDRHLLRRSLEAVFRLAHPYSRSPKQARLQYRVRIERMLNALNLSDVARDRLRVFLDPLDPTSHVTLPSDAAGNDPPRSISHSKQVLARAALLLRVATGCARDLLDSTGEDLRRLIGFWCSDASVRRTMWREQSVPASFVGLWDDADGSLETIEGWLENASTTDCAFAFWGRHSTEATILSTTERLCLMGLGL